MARQDHADQRGLRDRHADAGSVRVNGHDIRATIARARADRAGAAGTLHDLFETPWDTIRFSRGCSDCRRIRRTRTGVARSVAVEQAQGHDHDALRRDEAPRADREGVGARTRVLFLDEPTAGVDVELRRDMWAQVRRLRDSGVTIILTTHYIGEAEEMADRIGVINKGR